MEKSSFEEVGSDECGRVKEIKEALLKAVLSLNDEQCERVYKLAKEQGLIK